MKISNFSTLPVILASILLLLSTFTTTEAGTLERSRRVYYEKSRGWSREYRNN
eukprot:Pgem_evm1s17068